MSRRINIELEPDEARITIIALRRELLRNSDQEETLLLVNLIDYLQIESK